MQQRKRTRQELCLEDTGMSITKTIGEKGNEDDQIIADPDLGETILNEVDFECEKLCKISCNAVQNQESVVISDYALGSDQDQHKSKDVDVVNVIENRVNEGSPDTVNEEVENLFAEITVDNIDKINGENKNTNNDDSSVMETDLVVENKTINNDITSVVETDPGVENVEPRSLKVMPCVDTNTNPGDFNGTVAVVRNHIDNRKVFQSFDAIKKARLSKLGK